MRSIERLVLLILVAVAIFEHAVPVRAGADPRALTANEFTLLTDSGSPAGSFRISAEGLPELVLVDGMGRGRVVLAIKRNGDAMVAITDSAGIVRAGLLGETDGRHSMVLSDEKMEPRLSLSLTSKGLPRMSMQSANKKDLVSVEIDEYAAPRVSLTNESGDSRLEYGATGALGVFGLYLMGKGTAQRAGLEIDEANVAHVFAQDVGAKARAEFQAAPESLPSVTIKDKAGRKVPIK